MSATTEQERLWEEINKRGLEGAVEIISRMDKIESQNKRLNRRIEILEAVLLSVDLVSEVLKKCPQITKRYETLVANPDFPPTSLE